MIDILTNDALVTLIAIHAIAAIGMNLVYLTGQLNLGQAAFLAIGAYTTAWVDVKLGWALVPSLMAGAVAAAIVAFPVAVGANRVRGIYLIMGTLAVGELVRVAIGNIEAVGARQGYFGMEPVSRGGVYAALAVVLVLALLLVASSHGLRMRSIFDDEDAAAAAGVATRRVKIAAVMISAAVVAISGGLLAKWLLFIAPRDFGVGVSFEVALYTLIGGVHSLLGALVGATLITVLIEVLSKVPDLDYVPSALHFLSGWRLVVFGALVIVLMPALPEGLVSRRTGLALSAPFRTLRRRYQSTEEQTHRRAGADLLPPANTAAIALVGITHDFGGVRALNSVDFSVDHGEIVALIGANGAGKTTLIDVVGGRLSCQVGAITLLGSDVTHWRPEMRTRTGLARTFQNVRVFAHLTVEETVRLGWLAARPGGPSSSDVLQLVGLEAHRDVLPGRLTLSQRRHLEIARAVASNPVVVFLDEPSVGMNDDERAELATLVRAIRDLGVAVVVVDHNLDLALGVADRVVVLDFGEIIATGSADDVLHDPRVRRAYLGENEPEEAIGEVEA